MRMSDRLKNIFQLLRLFKKPHHFWYINSWKLFKWRVSMKNYINVFIILALFSSCKISLTMTMEEEKVEVVIEPFGAEITQPEVPTLMGLAAISLANDAIEIYDKFGLDVMVKYLSNLELSSEKKIPADLIDLIYYTMVKVLNRGDILVHRLFDLYENSKEIDVAKKIAELVRFLNYAPKETRNLLASDFARVIAKPIRNIDRKQFNDFVRNLIMYGDVLWLAKLYKSLESHQFGEFDEYKWSIVSEMRNAIANQINEVAKKISMEEQKKVQESRKIDISDDLKEFAKGLVWEFLSWNHESEEEQLEKELKDFDKQERNKVMDYTLLNYIDEFQNEHHAFVSLFEFIYPDEKDQKEQMGRLLKELMKDYPQTVEMMYLKSNVLGNARFINFIEKKVRSLMQNKIWNLLRSGDELASDKIIEEVNGAFVGFGFRFVVNLFKNLSYDLFKTNLDLSQKLEIVKILREVADKLSVSELEIYRKLGRSISRSLNIIMEKAWTMGADTAKT